MKRWPWARWVAVVRAVFALFAPPLKTLLGVYALWALLHVDTRRLFGVSAP